MSESLTRLGCRNVSGLSRDAGHGVDGLSASENYHLDPNRRTVPCPALALTWFVSISSLWGAITSKILHRIRQTLLQGTSRLSLTFHPKGFPGAPPDRTKSRRGGPSYQIYSSLTSSFRPEVFDNQIPFGLPLIPHPSTGFSMPSRTPRTMR